MCHPAQHSAGLGWLHRAEADSPGLLLTDLDVGELVRRHQHAAPASVGEVEHSGLVRRTRGDDRCDVVRRRVGLDHQLARDALDPDLGGV